MVLKKRHSIAFFCNPTVGWGGGGCWGSEQPTSAQNRTVALAAIPDLDRLFKQLVVRRNEVLLAPLVARVIREHRGVPRWQVSVVGQASHANAGEDAVEEPNAYAVHLHHHGGGFSRQHVRVHELALGPQVHVQCKQRADRLAAINRFDSKKLEPLALGSL